VASTDLMFFSTDGLYLGSKWELGKKISEITTIGEEYLHGDDPLSQASIAKRMSWASCQTTTRTEDLAYCLLGIFDINMPLLYGELLRMRRKSWMSRRIMVGRAEFHSLSRIWPFGSPLRIEQMTRYQHCYSQYPVISESAEDIIQAKPFS
jgi:hypothetical protein